MTMGFPRKLSAQEAKDFRERLVPGPSREELEAALAFYADERNWVNRTEVRAFPGFHGRAVAAYALGREVADIEFGESLEALLRTIKSGLLTEHPGSSPNQPANASCESKKTRGGSETRER